MMYDYFTILEPIGSMYGIFPYIWLIFMMDVGRYTRPMDPMGEDPHEKNFWTMPLCLNRPSITWIPR